MDGIGNALVSDLVEIINGVRYTYTQPRRWGCKQWLTFGGFLLSTAVISRADKTIKRAFDRAGKRGTRDALQRLGYRFGKPLSAILFTGTVYIAGLTTRDAWARRTGVMLAVTSLATGILQTFLKFAVGRARPLLEKGNLYFKPFSRQHGYRSFFSGHTAVSFGISFVMIRRINHPQGDILFYTLASVTALSRLYTDKHWISDIWTGAWLAWFCSKAASVYLSRHTEDIASDFQTPEHDQSVMLEQRMLRAQAV